MQLNFQRRGAVFSLSKKLKLLWLLDLRVLSLPTAAVYLVPPPGHDIGLVALLRSLTTSGKWTNFNHAETFERLFITVPISFRHFRFFCVWLVFFGFLTGRSLAQTPDFSQVHERWFETRTAHFHIYSYGNPQSVFKLAGRLEQFCEAYAWLAGARAIASPPIAVLAFPDHESLKPFLPLYNGQPANLAGFFKRSADENLIVLSLPSEDSTGDEMAVIFHEYTHLLFRHNDQFWPLWLEEGMAEVYSTFATDGRNVSIASPIDHHLELLKQAQMLPLAELFSVKHDSPQYNESSRQGIFYAESWLLTQFLMAGDQPVFRARFGRYTALLRQGENSEEAFTNALQVSLPVMEAQLDRYLNNGIFPPLRLNLASNVSAPVSIVTHTMTPVEIYFRLGDELLRIDRLDTAAAFFDRAQKLAPASPLPYEGQGLLAMENDRSDEAVRDLAAALERGSTSFLAWYIDARERYKLTADAGAHYTPLKDEPESEIRGKLERSLALQPDFGPAQELLGFFEMVQGDNPAEAAKHLQWAIQLEPENSSYLFTLAQFQYRNGDPVAARQTLEPLLKPNIEGQLREQAQQLIQENSR